MVLKIVRYLGQQGYDTDRLVILTPYLGQLRAIMDALKEVQGGDVVLSELDSRDLVRAGLMSDFIAKSVKKQIRIATIGRSLFATTTVFYAKRFIDNYQGEESDIVIASLTRSNQNHDIGFMSSPERLNVLLSRARDGLIMIGNVQTFIKARKGAEIWTKLVDHLKKHGNVYDGLPVICEQHPDHRSLLKTPADFDTECPDGGCTRPWYALLSSHFSEYQLILGHSGAILSCNIHQCRLKCHRPSDHPRMRCEFPLSNRCTNGHTQTWKCHDGPPGTCRRCERERKAAEEAKAEEAKLREQRETERSEHQREMAQLDEQLARLTIQDVRKVRLSRFADLYRK